MPYQYTSYKHDVLDLICEEVITEHKLLYLLMQYISEKDLRACVKANKLLNPEMCVICKKLIIGYGNNAEPVKKGICCDECDKSVVITARLQEMGIG